MSKLNKDTIAYANKIQYIARYNRANYEKITVQVKKRNKEILSKHGSRPGNEL